MRSARIALTVLTVTWAAGAHAEPRSSDVEHWYVTGPDGAKELRAHGYEGGIDRAQSHSGRASAFLRSTSEHPDYPQAVIWQSISSERYRGKRVRLSAWIKTERAQGAWLGMRISSAGGGVLAYGRQDTAGSADWRRYEVVLDVAPLAHNVNFGLLLEGTGTAWIDEVRLDVVDDRTPTTNLLPPAPLEPENLDFEQ
jgi:hypothetical protein